MLPPATAYDASATGLVVGGRALLKGWTFRETSATTGARVDLLDGSSGGRLLATITLAPSESVRDWLAETGLSVESGVFANVVSGAVAGSVWVIPENRFEGFSFPSVWAEGAQ